MARLRHFSFDVVSPQDHQAVGMLAFVGSGIVATTGKTGNGFTGTSGATQAQNTVRTNALNPATAAKGYHGFALKCVSLPAAERKVWAVFDNAGTCLVTLTVRTDGKVRAYSGTFESGTLLGTSATAFTASGAFRYLQVGYDFTEDTLMVLSTVSNVTSLLTAHPGLSSPQPWSYVEWYLDHLLVLDDAYINDASLGLGNSYFSGETAIDVVRPVSVVSHSYYDPWVANSGSDLAAPIDDATFDRDSTYIRTRESYSTIRYDMESLTDDGRTVDEVQHIAIVRAVSSGWLPGFLLNWRRWDGVVLPGGSQPITVDYRAYVVPLRATGALGSGNAWSIAHLNASDFGVAS